MNRHLVLTSVIGLFLGCYLALLMITPVRSTEALESPVILPTITTAPDPSPVPVAKPRLLTIKGLGINAQVEDVGLDKNRRMDVPKKDENVAWYAFGPQPGQVGSSVLAGHLDKRDGGPAVFYNLDQLKKGDEVLVTDENNRLLRFMVEEVAVYKDDDFPLERVFNTTDAKRLNLITCSGVFDKEEKNYTDRLVVYTRLVE